MRTSPYRSLAHTYRDRACLLIASLVTHDAVVAAAAAADMVMSGVLVIKEFAFSVLDAGPLLSLSSVRTQDQSASLSHQQHPQHESLITSS